MNESSLINYLGDSLKNQEFDQQLLRIGVEERPAGDDSTIFISSKDGMLDLTFRDISTYSEQNLIKPKSDGSFILEALTFYAGYKYSLPFGLSFLLTEEEAEKILGQPRKSIKMADGKISNTYLNENLLVIIRFKRHGHEIDFISIKVPDIFNQVNGLI
ncbi:hypothetical protein SD235_18055 (plasmid) [Burkholderia cepacia]|uniref:hypothetical protein n=1 Tax=Burkholderia cepacia TaxID=292 RepID=UPI003A4D2E22